MFIYLDESGDLGFDFRKKGTSKHFVMAALVCVYRRPIEKAVRLVHRASRSKLKGRSVILHATKEKMRTNRRFCEALSRQEFKIITVVVDKTRVLKKYRSTVHALYNQIARVLLEGAIHIYPNQSGGLVEVVVAKRETNKYLNSQFKKDVRAQRLTAAKAQIILKTMSEEHWLQAADVISWSIFRKHECNDDLCYSIIRNSIVKEKIWP
jgi:undecaprenyl pyrophosphate synthase